MLLPIFRCLTTVAVVMFLGHAAHAADGSAQPSSAVAEQANSKAGATNSDIKIKPAQKSQTSKNRAATTGSALNGSSTSTNSSSGARTAKDKSTNVGNNTSPGVGMSRPNLHSSSAPNYSGAPADKTGKTNKLDSWSQGTQNSGANAAVNGTGRQNGK